MRASSTLYEIEDHQSSTNCLRQSLAEPHHIWDGSAVLAGELILEGPGTGACNSRALGSSPAPASLQQCTYSIPIFPEHIHVDS